MHMFCKWPISNTFRNSVLLKGHACHPGSKSNFTTFTSKQVNFLIIFLCVSVLESQKFLKISSNSTPCAYQLSYGNKLAVLHFFSRHVDSNNCLLIDIWFCKSFLIISVLMTSAFSDNHVILYDISARCLVPCVCVPLGVLLVPVVWWYIDACKYGCWKPTKYKRLLSNSSGQEIFTNKESL